MAEQLALFELRDPVRPTRADQLERATLDHLDTFPDVWRLFVELTHELIRAGHAHGGAKAIAERIRWHALTSAHGASEYVINNSHIACMSRLFAATYPEHATFFRTRTRPSESRRTTARSARSGSDVRPHAESYGTSHGIFPGSDR